MRLKVLSVGLAVALGGCVIPLHGTAKAMDNPPAPIIKSLTKKAIKALDKAGKANVSCWADIRIGLKNRYAQELEDGIRKHGYTATVGELLALIPQAQRWC